MKKFLLTVASCAVLAFGAGQAVSSSGVAELSGVQGKVLVNQGKGYEAVVGSVMLNSGDSVMIGDKSLAQISYLSAKCQVTANASSVIVIAATAPCKAGEVIGMNDSVFIQPVMDGGHFPIMPFLIGGVVLVGGAYFLLSGHHHHSSGVSAP
jgi:hypothetical protein